MTTKPGGGMRGLYTLDVALTQPRKAPPARAQVTEWNWRPLDAHEQAAVTEGMRRDDTWGQSLIAGRTT